MSRGLRYSLSIVKSLEVNSILNPCPPDLNGPATPKKTVIVSMDKRLLFVRNPLATPGHNTKDSVIY